MKPITITGCGEGFNLDLPSSETPPGVWSGGLNMHCRHGMLKNRLGFAAAFTTPTATPYWLMNYISATARFIIQAGTASIFADDGSTRTDITPTPAPSGARDDRWTGGDFNGVPVFNNGVDGPWYWDGDIANDAVALTGWPANYTAKTLRPFKEYLVAGNIYDGSAQNPQLVMWSNAANPGALPTAWTASATNDAGDDPFSGVGAVVDFLPLGDVNIVYGQMGRVAMQYVGGNDVFRFQRLPGEDGLLARGCVVDTPVGHVFMSSLDVMLHSGGLAVSIADGVCLEYLRQAIDTTNAARSFLCVNKQEKQVWGSPYTIPNLTYGTTGLISSGLAGSWAADTETWEEDVTSWDQDPYSTNEARLVVSTSAPLIGLANTGATDFGTAVTWYAEKYGISLGDPDKLKTISRSRPHIKAVADTAVLVKHATTANPEDTPVFSGYATFTVGSSTFANLFSTTGRYLAYRIESNGSQQIAMRTYELELGTTGARF
jgi:hypothetical protein